MQALRCVSEAGEPISVTVPLRPEAPARRLSCSEDVVEEGVGLVMVYKAQLTTNCGGINGVCLKPGKEWMLPFYLFGVIVMFVGLAIVCDEFFVPSLEVFVDELDISPDVAGATFMAAGGSMPELFTSFIGTFQDSDIGFAAIVGSAVFNVLFVIAVCAVASKEVLTLSPWPLARDCTFYVLALLSLVVFLQGPSPNVIQGWEAGVLLTEYVVYCVFMKHNQKVLAWLRRRSPARAAEPAWGPDTADPVVPDGAALAGRESSKASLFDELHENHSFLKPSTFRRSIVQMLTHSEALCDTAGMAAVAQVAGDIKESFDSIDQDGSGFIEEGELGELLERLGCGSQEAAAEALRLMDRKGDGRIGFQEFQKWYLASEARIDLKVRRVFRKLDADSSGTIDRAEVATALRKLGHVECEEAAAAAVREILGCSSGRGVPGAEDDLEKRASQQGVQITFDEFQKWYSKSLFWRKQMTLHEAERRAAEEDGGFSIEVPQDACWSAMVWYRLTYPLCAAMYCTMPDVRRRGQAKLSVAVAEFLLSLAWIGLFSFCLVDWVTVASTTVRIPTAVAGVTILAAGTSIPDLLSSYVVARKGEGDMAVSSSIGSNIFDVLVGLPLPWLCSTLVRGRPAIVGTESLPTMVVILIAMLVAVLCSVKCLRWRMTRTLGYVMFMLYGVFILLFLLL